MREQLAMDVRSPRERSRDDAYQTLADAFDQVRELLEEVAAAADLHDQERLDAAVAAAVEWWRAQ